MKLPFKIYSYNQFWTLRNWVQRINFSFKKKVFETNSFLKEQGKELKSSNSYFKITFVSILKSGICVIGILYFEYSITSFWYANFDRFPNWLIQVQKIIPKPNYVKYHDVIYSFISVIASINGVILALFYPVIATIIATAYARVHESVRNLILREKVTQHYLRKLTFLTSFSIGLLLALACGITPGNLSLLLLFVYALANIFNLLNIGMGVYTLLEPSNLLKLVTGDISESITNVTIEGLNWSDRNFQNKYYKDAYRTTENINLITQLCIQDYIRESSLKSSVKTSLSILSYYLNRKPKIPTNSLWFPSAYTHLSYFESDMTRRNLSKNTNTYIHPDSKQNHFWFEERMINNISGSLEAVFKSNRLDIFGQIILLSYGTIDSLSFATDIRSGQIILDSFLKNIKIIDVEDNINRLNYESWKHELGCFESYCYAVLRFQIGVFDRATEFNSIKINKEYSHINFEKRSSIYLPDFIPDLYQNLDRFHNNVLNEIQVEGHRVTPDWYFKQAITAEYLSIITKKLTEVISFFESHIISLQDHLNGKNGLLTSFVAHIGLEAVHKIQYRIAELKPILIDLDSIELCKDEFKWIKPDFDKFAEQLSGYENKCLSVIAENIEKLAVIKWDNQFKDVLGQSYSVLTTKLNVCFQSNSIKDFRKYFPIYLRASIEAFNNNIQVFNHYNDPRSISYQTLIEVMQISGLAYIYSGIYNDPEYWLIVRNSWDENFEASEQNIELLVSQYNYYKNILYGTGISFNEKHLRELTLSDVIKKRKIKVKDIDDVLIKPFVEGEDRLHFEDTAELFIEIYLFTFIAAKGATKLLRRRSIFRNW